MATEVLDAAGLRARASAAPALPRALWVRDASAVDDPGAVVQAYARWFTQLGGTLLEQQAQTLRRDGARWRVERPGAALRAGRVVLALGPWSPGFLRETAGPAPAMGFERGYHRHFSPPAKHSAEPAGSRHRRRLRARAPWRAACA